MPGPSLAPARSQAPGSASAKRFREFEASLWFSTVFIKGMEQNSGDSRRKDTAEESLVRIFATKLAQQCRNRSIGFSGAGLWNISR